MTLGFAAAGLLVAALGFLGAVRGGWWRWAAIVLAWWGTRALTLPFAVAVTSALDRTGFAWGEVGWLVAMLVWPLLTHGVAKLRSRVA